ncbi:BTAD domain-containing putative transcriptional regulator [Nonomuraea sp. NPDC049141]|uniref:AfsR/SARP family transcriptional regulator n=1 Tax=Nonomuraea sp. NPDC049141 TaxID=3155500 RepID=UPI0033F9CC9A
MEFRLLGPLEVWASGKRVSLGGRKPRTLLTALLIEANRVVTAERLVDAVWGEEPPGSARSIIQTYVSGLRHTLCGVGGGDLIVSHPAGYLIRVPAGALDRDEFERLAGKGRLAAESERHLDAVEAFSSALGLWRGEALGGVRDSSLRSEAARLDELRVAVMEQRITSELALGRHEQLVGELTALVGRYPTRERLCRDLMVVLCRLGRRADALATYRQTREVLVTELGIEPGTELQTVHEMILRSDDVALGGTADAVLGGSAGPADHRVVPAQMPSAVPDFTGRVDEVASVRGVLLSGSSSPICVISGLGGSGKSALAVQVAHLLQRHYPDGQLYVELRGTSETPVSPMEVLGRVLRQLGVVPADTLEARIADYRSVLAGQRVLIVLDDARAEHQVRPLLPGSPGSGVLITSRNRLAGLAGMALIELDVLTPGESLVLLGRVAGPERIKAEPEAAVRIVHQCGRLPLAIRIAGARLAARRAWPVTLLANRLHDERRRLDELAIGDQEIRASVGLGFRMLDEQDKRALRLLGWMGLPNFPAWVAAALLDVVPEAGEQVLERLVDAHLMEVEGVDRVGQVRYRLHDLVRLFAREQAESQEASPARDAAVIRVLSRWLWLLREVTSVTRSGAVPLHIDYWLACAVDPPLAQAVLADPAAWFDIEQNALVQGVELAAALNLDEAAIQLASALYDSVFVSNNLFDAWSRTHNAALMSARRLGNAHGEATLLAELGQLRYEQDRFAEASKYFSQALSMFRIAGRRDGEAAALAGLGLACREQGYMPEALHFLGEAEEVWRDLGDDGAMAHVKRAAGAVHLEQGDYRVAWRKLKDALWLYRKIASRRGEGMTLRTMALYHRARGELEAADDAGGRALKIFREIGDRLMAAYALRTCAKTWIRMSRHAQARRALEEALTTCRTLDDRFGTALTLRTIGELDLAQGRFHDARNRLEDSLRRCETLDLPLWSARAMRDVAFAYEALGETARAQAVLAEALETFRTYGSREYGELSASPLQGN